MEYRKFVVLCLSTEYVFASPLSRPAMGKTPGVTMGASSLSR